MRVPVLLVVSMILAGCGSKETGDGFETPERDGERYVIRLTEDRTFEPAKAQVPPDALVTFRFGLDNCDVRSEEAEGPDSRQQQYANGIYPKGGSFGWFAPSSPMDIHIYCSAHEDKGMTGIIRVA